MSTAPVSIGAMHHESRMLRRLRIAILPAAIGALAIALTLVAIRPGATAALPVDLGRITTSDTFGVGATTQATLELRNHGHADIRPRFSVTWLPYPYYWRIDSGPAVLGPGQTATYVVEAPDPTSAPPNGTYFTLRVNDAGSITYAISSTLFVDNMNNAVRNPTFKLWTRDPTTGLQAPLGWQSYSRSGSGDQTIAEPVDAFGVKALHLGVVQDGQPDPGGWTHTGVTQEIPFPTHAFSITVLSRAPFVAQTGGWPLTAFGFEVSDPKNGLVWILFQPTGVGDLEYDLPSGHHIKVFDVPLGQWATRRVDLSAMYRALGWEPAGTVTLKLFIAASSARPADIDGLIANVAEDAPSSR
jgi:hypothetical protein